MNKGTQVSNQIFFDSVDIDRIVKTMTIAEIEGEILKAETMLQGNLLDENWQAHLKEYWVDRLKAFRLAKEIAEWQGFNLTIGGENRMVAILRRLSYLSRKVLELEGKIKFLLEKQKEPRKKGGRWLGGE